MKTNKLFVVLSLITSILVVQSCEENEDNNIGYHNLEYAVFFKLSDDEIVDSISEILNIQHFEYEGTTDRWEDDHGVAGFNWINEGKKYINTDGQSIILWKDSNKNLTTITYLHYRHSHSEIWSNTEIQIKDYLDNVFTSLGLTQKPNEEFSINESAGGEIKWYDARCKQTYQNDTLEYPTFHSELEGGSCKINYMMIPVWYTNLDSINDIVSSNELKEIAENFFVSNFEGTVEMIGDVGYWIVYNKLCQAFGARIVGKRGGYRVFIDVQTGEIVFNTVI